MIKVGMIQVMQRLEVQLRTTDQDYLVEVQVIGGGGGNRAIQERICLAW